MITEQLIKIYENRRKNLIKIKEEAFADVDSDIVHQMEGAIMEINGFLKLLNKIEKEKRSMKAQYVMENFAK